MRQDRRARVGRSPAAAPASASSAAGPSGSPSGPSALFAPGATVGRSSRPEGSAGFRAAPSSTGRLTVSASSRPSTPTDRQSNPDALRFGSRSGRRVNPRSSKQRTSQRPDPTNSQMYAPHGVLPGLAQDQQHPRDQDEQQQQVEVPHAPEAAELEEERHASPGATGRARLPGRDPERNPATRSRQPRPVNPTRRGGVRPRAGTAR